MQCIGVSDSLPLKSCLCLLLSSVISWKILHAMTHDSEQQLTFRPRMSQKCHVLLKCAGRWTARHFCPAEERMSCEGRGGGGRVEGRFLDRCSGICQAVTFIKSDACCELGEKHTPHQHPSLLGNTTTILSACQCKLVSQSAVLTLCTSPHSVIALIRPRCRPLAVRKKHSQMKW